MATRSVLVVVFSLVLFAVAWPVHADMEKQLAEEKGAIVHFLFRRPTPSTRGMGTQYKAPAPARVGLWRSPPPEELGRIYLERSDGRQPEQTMPLLVVEW